MHPSTRSHTLTPTSSTDTQGGGLAGSMRTHASITMRVAHPKSSSTRSQSANGSSSCASKPAEKITNCGRNNTISSTICDHLVLNCDLISPVAAWPQLLRPMWGFSKWRLTIRRSTSRLALSPTSGEGSLPVPVHRQVGR